ncbi:YqaJ viral recombinase family protein [Lamprobacter modestohalophilus]|uniref:YqaJ viral recombinase family nuclease n=1 Tax=Lamprobacter modestohalophilus TaxID=1064514 RepID=UPI002ADED53E|nr:YqaJ viral recombinase family protein [Lamprobacter modestohalophilus]MEA1053376.1 YqaJ viral recombinase family protein [Lamprobacter modestohalophilus]
MARAGHHRLGTPVILGHSPYKTPWRLWAERTGLARPPDLSNNPHVQRGNRLEEAARQWVEQRDDTLLMPLCAEADEEPLLRASFDGLNDAGEPVELKVPAAKTFAEVRRHGRASLAYRLYAPQVQHQLYVAGAETGYLVFYQDADHVEVFELQRDPALIRRLVAEGLAFWEAIQANREPEKDPARDLFIPTGEPAEAWRALAGRYRRVHARVQGLEAELKAERDRDALQTDLIALMGDALIAESDGLHITRFCAKGSVDYPELLKALLPDLDAQTCECFRRKSSERVRVSVQEEADKASIDFDADAVAQAADAADAKDFWF